MIEPFPTRYRNTFDDRAVAPALLEFQRSWKTTRDGQIRELESESSASFETLREQLRDAKRTIRSDLTAAVERFKAAAAARGTVVHEGGSAEEAATLITHLCRDAKAGTVVKGKSMLTEEIFLNEALESAGITAVETDLGEWILQLAGKRPSHVVMPAIHMTRAEVATTLEEALGRRFDPDDIPAMVRAARTELRDRFFSAEVGITGANFLVAETGTVGIVCNEGNNRMASAIPDTNIIVAGVDKLLPNMAAAMLQVRLLARSATGQRATTYTNFVSGPRTGQTQHLVLVDNGRTKMAGTEGFAEALACIRCGACADVCPPYQVVGGQVFGHVYSGAIGLVNTSFHHGIDAAAGPQGLCVSCAACTTVCPVAIPLTDQILRVRRNIYQAGKASRLDRATSWLFRSKRRFAAATRIAGIVGAPLRKAGFSRAAVPRRHASWRRPPVPPLRPARSRLKGRNAEPGPGVVGIFLQCISDRVAPAIALSTVRLVEAAGYECSVPKDQHCCGLPAFDSGDWDTAAALAQQTIEVFDPFDRVVTPGTSCAAAARHDFAELLQDRPGWPARAAAFAAKVQTVEEFVLDHLDRYAFAATDGRISVHRFCQSTNLLGAGDLLERLMAATGAVVAPIDEAAVCCGFGGTTSARAPEMASGILSRKLEAVEAVRPNVLVTQNPGCVLHIGGGLAARSSDTVCMHIAEYLADRLQPSPPGG